MYAALARQAKFDFPAIPARLQGPWVTIALSITPFDRLLNFVSNIFSVYFFRASGVIMAKRRLQSMYIYKY